ncbi:hypothetical protein [Romboutsia ilealis]|uniref:hypothetical protein n=1 Tax=Romboutsia ilealis TaxID=1115758 RepID=UPI002170F047|nr:hypothetical protein [Romboutsia ilealis]MCI9259773.1 hypothetical protein [Romboutsia sp.]
MNLKELILVNVSKAKLIMPDNSPKEIRQLIFKVRRIIETSFSQLTEQLNLSNIKNKSILGFMS